jgi:hypothetical protein
MFHAMGTMEPLKSMFAGTVMLDVSLGKKEMQ